MWGDFVFEVAHVAGFYRESSDRRTLFVGSIVFTLFGGGAGFY